MTEPTAPVPVSLIERAMIALLEVPPSSRNADIYGELRALLSQSTPSAEPDFWANIAASVDRKRMSARQPTAPPNIADMAPGTTFTAEVRFLVDSHGTALSHSGFNPCTVRDVTPPESPNAN